MQNMNCPAKDEILISILTYTTAKRTVQTVRFAARLLLFYGYTVLSEKIASPDLFPCFIGDANVQAPLLVPRL